MTEPAAWGAAADPGRRIGRLVEFHPTIGSTNDRASELLAAGEEGIAVVADLQMAGRGRHGRSWTSPAGVNLMVSLGLRVDLDASVAWQLGGAAALALLAACASALPSSVRLALKWPNDLVDATGRKIAGLLLETRVVGERVREAVIGCGINVNWPHDEMPDEIASRATSLFELAGSRVSRVDLLARYLASLDAEIALVVGGVSPVERLRDASCLIGREVTVSAAGEILSGIVTGIGDDGSLLLQTDGGSRSLGLGEVVRVGSADAGVPA